MDKGKTRSIPKKNWEELRSVLDINRDRIKSSAEKEERISEARKFYDSIMEKLPQGRHGMLAQRKGTVSEEAHHSALAGLLAAFLGDEDGARSHYSRVYENARIDNGVYLQKVGGGERSIYVSAVMGILATFAGDDKEAERIYRFTKKKRHIGPNKMYKKSDGATIESTDANSAMALFELAMGNAPEARKIYQKMKKVMPMGRNGLHGYGVKENKAASDLVKTDAEALFGALAAAMGDIKQADDTLHFLDAGIRKGANGLYVGRIDSNSESAGANAAIGILICSIADPRIWG